MTDYRIIAIDEVAERFARQAMPPRVYGRLRCPSFTIPRIAEDEWREEPKLVYRRYGKTDVDVAS